MALYVRDKSTVPQGGWKYPRPNDPEKFITAHNYELLYRTIVETYRSNNAPIPTEEEVIAWMCERLYIACYQGREPFVNLWTKQLPPPLPKGCCGGYKAPIPK